MEDHIKDLKQQLRQREDIIDQLRDDLHKLKMETQASFDKVKNKRNTFAMDVVMERCPL